MTFKAIIFDLDGTLLDTLSDIGNAVNRVLSRHGFPTHAMDAFRRFIGDGATALMARALPETHRDEATVLACYDDFREDYRQNWNIHTCPYDGISGLLDFICGQGIRLSVLSNKPHDMTVKCVDALLGSWPFEIVFGHRPEVPKKPDPAGALEIAERMGVLPSDCMFVGDSGIDMITARLAGMPAAGACWGFRPKEELAENGADLLLRHPSDLMALLRNKKVNSAMTLPGP